MTTIRHNTNPRKDIASELQSTLNANGMQAHISTNENGDYVLTALAHNTSSPTEYIISPQQAEAMMNGGQNVSNKKAYQTFVSIVKNDYYIPENYVSARNAGSPVNMGLNGHRLNPGEYGYRGERDFEPFRGSHYGLFSNLFDLFRGGRGYDHYRRVNDRPYLASSAPVVADRPDGRLKPGELKTGGYGFYRKENAQKDALDNLTINAAPVVLSRPKGQATTLNDTLGDYSPELTFSKDKFNKCLAEHGIVIDTAKKIMIIKADGVNKDLQYDLTDKDISVILNDKLKVDKPNNKNKSKASQGVTVQQRLDLINALISKDFADKITVDHLNSKDYINIKLKPEVEKELGLSKEQVAQVHPGQDATVIDMRKQLLDYNTGFIDKWNSIGVVDGRSLASDKGFYLPVKDGRAVSVGEIQAYPTNDGQKSSYRMTAVINNQIVNHDISEKDYIKFLNYDDENRLKLFDKIFNEVEMKSASHGEMQDPIRSKNIEQASGVVTLNGNYSLVNSSTTAAITGAMAWKDQSSGDYQINVRTNKDVGMWSFKITEAQYNAFKNATDKERAAMLTTLIPFKDENKETLKVVETASLHPDRGTSVSLGKSRLEEVAEVINNTPRLHAEIVDDPKFIEKLKELNKLAIQKGSENGLSVKMLSDKELVSIAASSSTTSDVLKGIINKNIGKAEIADTKLQQIAYSIPSNLSGNLDEMLHKMKQPAAQPSEHETVHYGKEEINLNDLRTATKLNVIGDAGVNGESLDNIKSSKEWRRSGEHGRATDVGDIAVERVRDAQGNVVEGKYKMTAVIDGNPVTHDITQKEFNKFLVVNDYQRMKLFDKIFPEVEMQTKAGHGFNLGAAILAAVTTGLDVAAGVIAMAPPSRPRPEIYEAKVFSKPGVVSPEAAAAAAFESLHPGPDRGHEEGMGMGR